VAGAHPTHCRLYERAREQLVVLAQEAGAKLCPACPATGAAGGPDLRRRSAIAAEIGHMKTDGRLSQCPLKGTIGDALFAVLCAYGAQHPKDPGPPQGLACLDHRGLVDCSRTAKRPLTGSYTGLTPLFRMNYMMVEAFAEIDKEEIDPILSITTKAA
jgi:hypothetical protein